jgi:O-succinylbenzoic acid--CoA ligase
VLLPPAEAAAALLEALPAALDGSGPALLPLDPALPRARLAGMLSAWAPTEIQTAEGIERVAGRRSRTLAAVPVADEVAVVVATSGSTGQPKAAELPGPALLASASASLRRIGAAPGERWLCCLPAFHIAGIQVLIRSILAGAEPVVTERVARGVLESADCCHASLVPAQLRRLLDAGADLTGLRTILLGGSAIPAGLLGEAGAAGARVVTTYGMTETCGGCVYDGVGLDGVEVAVGADSRIRVAGPVLFSGYRLRPDLTARARDGRWFLTSDLGSLGPSGVLSVRGRADDVIVTGGNKVVPAEVEAALARCPGVLQAAVVGMPDPEWGERVTAVVVPSDPAKPPELAALRARVSGDLPGYAAPRGLVIVPAIPMLASGKPDRQAMRGWGA